MKIWISVLAVLALSGCANMAYYHRQTTAELRLHHVELTEQLQSEQGSFEIGYDNMLNPSPRDLTTAELRHTDEELLRRYEAGDKSAWLPEFAQAYQAAGMPDQAAAAQAQQRAAAGVADDSAGNSPTQPVAQGMVYTARAQGRSPAGEIQSVLNQCAAISKKASALNVNPVAKDGYVADGFQAIDASRCPQDFRVAFQGHINAWRNAPFDGQEINTTYFRLTTIAAAYGARIPRSGVQGALP